MRQFEILISDECVSDIVIGRQGEKDVTTISFDITEWFDLFGRAGNLVLLFQRPTDTAPYPINLVATENTATWSVSAADCAIKGVGEAEIRYSVDDKIVKSRIYSVRILRALGDETTPPDPWEDWFEQVLAAADRAEKAATEAESAAESAESYSSHPPRIGAGGNWELWNGTGYASTDYPSRGENGAQGPQGERGEKGEQGEQGPAGSDADVTEANIRAAGGLVAPETMSVGQFFRIASFDGDGHAILECVDAPVSETKIKLAGTKQTPDSEGYVEIPRANAGASPSYGLFYGSSNGGFANGIFNQIYLSKIDEHTLNSRSYRPADNVKTSTYAIAVTQDTIDMAVKHAMTDGVGKEWTDEEKTGAWSRQAIIKTAMDSVAVAGASYFLGTQTAVSVVLPTTAEIGQMISVSWYNGATAATLSITGTMLDFTYAPSANSRSEINALWDGTYWAVLGHETAVTDVD